MASRLVKAPDAYIDIRMRSIHTDLSAGALNTYRPFSWSARSESKPQRHAWISCPADARAPVWLLVLGVRLNIETGRFPAVSALAARCNTQLIHTDTSLHPHKHLFAARKKQKKTFIFVWFYVKRHFRPPSKLKGRWLKAWNLRTASSHCMHECLFYMVSEATSSYEFWFI